MNNSVEKISCEQAESVANLTCHMAQTCFEKENYVAALFNLTPAEFKCLRLFSKKYSLTIKELISFLRILTGRITHILISLETKNYIIRKADPSDKRNVIVLLTDKSMPFIKNLHASHIRLHKDTLQNIDADKRNAGSIESIEIMVIKHVG